MVKARVTQRFFCISNKRNVEIGDVVVYSKERAKEILSKGDYIEILEVAPEPKQEATQSQTPVKQTRKRKNEN
jgi:hypothetical protein